MDNCQPEGQADAGRFNLDPALAGRLQKKFGHKKRLAPPRKNLYYVVQLVNTFVDLGAETITSLELQAAVDELGWRQKWQLDPNPIDDNGLRKELAGLVGGFGLRLPKVRAKDANVYRLPKTRVDDEYLRGVGVDPDLVASQAVNRLVTRAIRQRHAISFRYRDDPELPQAVRVVNPHFYGNQSGADNVEGLQVSGYSSRGNLPAWRVFRLDYMRDIRLLPDTDFVPWPGYRREHSKYSQPYEMV